MQRYLFTIVFCATLAAFFSPARAQFLCNVTVGKNIGANLYISYASLTCDGNDCMVAAKTLPDTSYGFGHVAFLRSVDGGHAWLVQNPGIADSLSAITGIDQIGSSNIVAYGFNDPMGTPYALLLRTTDGGAIWQREAVPTAYQIDDVSFFNSMDGVLAAAGGPFITYDGGAHWDTIPFSSGAVEQCHDYGGGMYRGFRWYTGEVYTTRDGGLTFDSTGPIVTDPGRGSLYFYENCAFGHGDTMLAYGWHRLSSSEGYPCIARTTDGGHLWVSVFDDATGITGNVTSISDLNRDTIVAGVTGWRNLALWSTDNGATWEVDSLICSDTNLYQSDGIGLNTEGELVGAFNHFVSGQPVMNSLIIGEHVSSGVVLKRVTKSLVQLFPNPAMASVTLTGAEAGCKANLLDMIGREVLHAKVPVSGSLTLDVSHLPRGIYMAMMEHDGEMLPVGRIVLAGN